MVQKPKNDFVAEVEDEVDLEEEEGVEGECSTRPLLNVIIVTKWDIFSMNVPIMLNMLNIQSLRRMKRCYSCPMWKCKELHKRRSGS